MTLRSGGPDYAPLRTFRDDDLLDPGSDPVMAVMGALASLNEGERVVARLLLRSLGPDWAGAHEAFKQGGGPQQSRPRRTSAGQPGARWGGGPEDGGAGPRGSCRNAGLFLVPGWRDPQGRAAGHRGRVGPGGRGLGVGPVSGAHGPGSWTRFSVREKVSRGSLSMPRSR